MAITREQVNREYPFDADDMSQDDYDDLARAMAQEDRQEIERITKLARENNVNQGKLALEKIEVKDKETTEFGIISQIENYVKSKDYLFAFNVMNVLLELYEIFSEDNKLEIISQFTTYNVSTENIRTSIHRLDSVKMFQLVMQM